MRKVFMKKFIFTMLVISVWGFSQSEGLASGACLSGDFKRIEFLDNYGELYNAQAQGAAAPASQTVAAYHLASFGNNFPSTESALEANFDLIGWGKYSDTGYEDPETDCPTTDPTALVRKRDYTHQKNRPYKDANDRLWIADCLVFGLHEFRFIAATSGESAVCEFRTLRACKCWSYGIL